MVVLVVSACGVDFERGQPRARGGDGVGTLLEEAAGAKDAGVVILHAAEQAELLKPRQRRERLLQQLRQGARIRDPHVWVVVRGCTTEGRRTEKRGHALPVFVATIFFQRAQHDGDDGRREESDPSREEVVVRGCSSVKMLGLDECMIQGGQDGLAQQVASLTQMQGVLVRSAGGDVRGETLQHVNWQTVEPLAAAGGT